jgi:hypothetical protein
MGEGDVKTRLIDEAVDWMLSWSNVYTFMNPPAWVFRWREGGLAAVVAAKNETQEELSHPQPPDDKGVLTSSSSAWSSAEIALNALPHPPPSDDGQVLYIV